MKNSKQSGKQNKFEYTSNYIKERMERLGKRQNQNK